MSSNQNNGMSINVSVNNDSIICELMDKNTCVSSCRINITEKTWTISSWYTAKDQKHNGYGKHVLQTAMQNAYFKTGRPDKVEYIWNGANQYVYDWMSKHFEPVSRCPLAVQKYASCDDWESHIYILNVEKVLNYFGIA